MTTENKTWLANAAVIVLASAIVVPPLLMVVAVMVLGKQLMDCGPTMLVFWTLLFVSFLLGLFTRDTSKGRFVLVASILLPVVLVMLKLIARWWELGSIGRIGT